MDGHQIIVITRALHTLVSKAKKQQNQEWCWIGSLYKCTLCVGFYLHSKWRKLVAILLLRDVIQIEYTQYCWQLQYVLYIKSTPAINSHKAVASLLVWILPQIILLPAEHSNSLANSIHGQNSHIPFLAMIMMSYIKSQTTKKKKTQSILRDENCVVYILKSTLHKEEPYLSGRNK